jgi:hypothetical protein
MDYSCVTKFAVSFVRRLRRFRRKDRFRVVLLAELGHFGRPVPPNRQLRQMPTVKAQAPLVGLETA